MRGLVFHPVHNSPGSHDDTGAFEPGAHTFADVNHIPRSDVFTFDNTVPLLDRDDVLGTIATAVAANGKNYADVVAFFCHGWQHGIMAGFDQRAPKVAKHTPAELGAALDTVLHGAGTILLYACSTAEDRQHGFARDLFTEVPNCKALYAHDRLGHAYENPYVVRYDDASLSAGGVYVIAPGSVGWVPWVKQLRDTTGWATFW